MPIISSLKKLFTFNYYLEILQTGKGIHPLLVALILALATILIPTYHILRFGLPIALNVVGGLTKLIDEIYPEELEIIIKNGVASTNVTEPYYLTVQEKALGEFFTIFGAPADAGEISQVRLLAIDTKAKAEDFERYQSLALLTETNLVYYREDQINLLPLREIEDFTLNKEIIMKEVNKLAENKTLPVILSVLVLILPGLTLIGVFLYKLVAIALQSFAVWLMAKIHSFPLAYRRSFRYTAAITLVPSLIWTGLGFTPVLGFYFTATGAIVPVIVFGLAYLGLKQAKK